MSNGENESGKGLRSFLKNNSVALIIYLIVIILVIGSKAIEPSFGSWSMVKSILVLASFLAVVAFGQGMVILIGELDLSVAANLTLSGVLFSSLMGQVGSSNPVQMILLIIAVLTLIGIFNGVGVAYLKIPSFIMTLASQSIVLGIILGVTKGVSLGESPHAIRYLMTKGVAGIPYIVILFIAFIIIATLWQRNALFARKIYMVGSNRAASYIAGIHINKVIIGAYLISAWSAGLAGLMMVGYVNGSALTMGDSYLLPSIAAVVIGGTLITGGKGGYVGTSGAAILLITASIIIQALGISQGWQTFIYGLIIMLVLVTLQSDFGNRRSKKEVVTQKS
jgi:ribose transport system permease protein